jgi:uncharacterized protein
MTDAGELPGRVRYDEIVPAGQPWGHVIRAGEVLRLIDLEGQQAVDFLCFDATDPSDRYCATNTIKVQGSIYIGNDTVLYSDHGAALMTVIADTCGRHDTIYGEILARFGLDERSIVGNVNFFMSVPVLPDGTAGIAEGVSLPGSYVDLRAERDVIAVLSNCPQMHNPCNGYNPTPIRALIYRPLLTEESR